MKYYLYQSYHHAHILFPPNLFSILPGDFWILKMWVSLGGAGPIRIKKRLKYWCKKKKKETLWTMLNKLIKMSIFCIVCFGLLYYMYMWTNVLTKVIVHFVVLFKGRCINTYITCMICKKLETNFFFLTTLE